MITEDYVSVETAKLLREKGFDEVCFKYALNGKIYNNGDFVICHEDDIEVGIPTIQMAMKWLREKHNLFIIPDTEHHYADEGKENTYYDVYYNIYYTTNHNHALKASGFQFKKIEEAEEAAIKYCLENLI